jgi:hypothetical protein
MPGSHISVASNGTIHSWRPSGMSRSIIYPERKEVIGGTTKDRGGAYVCSPIFGSVPKTERYHDINLPRHGLVRQHETQARVTQINMGGLISNLAFKEPWQHQVSLSVLVSNDGKNLRHTVQVRNDDGQAMPLSLGFHPYFSTNGRPFEIRHGGDGQRIRSRDIKLAVPLFITLGRKKTVSLCVNGALIFLTMQGYTHICIWTDNPEKYICVEPVRRHSQGGDLLLEKGKTQKVSCLITANGRCTSKA